MCDKEENFIWRLLTTENDAEKVAFKLVWILLFK